MGQGRYNFSVDNDGKHVAVVISKELHERIITLCNITELTKTAIVRYLLKRGVADMEQKMLELANKNLGKEVTS